ncbi:sensor histidine kinase [Mucilaginibacter agri]|uniref:histidine kinase n=1 Tax=Mucilaginibacter agri TaxID=2695265 RepID=A0A965ZHV6_9SPHI|nr:PAS domain S-box protein [Mucilaginibacter agri]NCD71000.1 PAS domain S-box protein [Mucilaginibacter agri]
MPSQVSTHISIPYFLQRGGELGELIRNYNWAETKLGALETWPQILKNTLSIILKSKFPMLIWWGPDLILFYNDAFKPYLERNGKHPIALGQRGEDGWPEVWPIIKPLIDRVMSGGESTWSEDQLIPVYRDNKLEEVYWTFSYSGLTNEDGLIEGVLVTCAETTAQLQAYKEVNNAKNELEFAIESAELGTWDLDPVTNRFVGNTRLKNWFGIAADKEIELSEATDLIEASDRQRVLSAISKALTYESGGSYDIEYAIINPQTLIPRYVRAKGKALFNQDKQPIKFSGILQDISEERKAAKELKRNRAQLEQTYEQVRLSKEAAMLGTFDMDLESGNLEWDARCRVLFGINHNDKVTYEKDFVLGLHPEDRDRILDVINKSFIKSISNGDYDVEYRTVGAEDQKVRWIRAKGKVYFDEYDKPIRFIGSVLDITDQKLDQIRLMESAEKQARLAAIVSTSDDTIVSKTLQGIITSWNIAAERMFGYTEAEIIGKHISLIIPPSRLKEEDFIISQIASGNKIDHFETIRIAKDGHEIPLSISVSPITDETGKVIGASKIARDISAQWAAQETARRYTERLEIMNLMVETISEELDLNKILQKITDATTELTGAQFGAFFYNNIDEKGESFLLYTLSGAPKEMFEKFGMPRNTAVFHPTFSGQGVVRVDDITKDSRYGKSSPHFGMPKGHLPVVSYLAVPVVSRSGTVIGGLFFGHPEPGKFTKEHESLVVSIAAQSAIGIDNAKLYEQVKLLNDKKDEFIGLASHELKTPLTSINGYLQILSRLKMDDKQQRFVDKTLQQVQKLTTLVNDLLDISKIEAGQLQLNIQKFDLKELLNDVIELIQHSNENYQITLNTTVENCIVNADSQRIEQVLLNLLTNAIKYSPGANTIELSLTCTAHEVQVDVKDFGLGIPENKIGQIFSRFYRVEDLNPTISGLGIGLYLACEIVTRHNGRLWVNSEIDVGSTFHFTLPLN